MVAALLFLHHSRRRSSPRMLTSQRENDSESALMHFRARSLDPRTGRFLEKDPLRATRVQQHYTYASNQPVIGVDPTGNQTVGEIERAASQEDWRLHLELLRLKQETPPWRVQRKALWTVNSEVDWDNHVLYIDSDQEGIETGVEWLRDVVLKVYQKDPIRRRRAIAEEARTGANANSVGVSTALETFAKTIDFAVWYETSASDFAADISRVFTGGQPNATRTGWTEVEAGPVPGGAFIGQLAFFRGGMEFGSTGFKREFRDDGNQVRHAAFAMATSVAQPNIGLAALQLREPAGGGFADRRLNSAMWGISTELQLFTIGPPRFGPKPPSAVARLIREVLGDPSEVGPWDGPPDGDR